MWQVEISKRGEPVTTVTGVAYALQDTFGMVLPFELEPVDAELGEWLVLLPDADVATLEADRYFEKVGAEHTVRVELP